MALYNSHICHLFRGITFGTQQWRIAQSVESTAVKQKVMSSKPSRRSVIPFVFDKLAVCEWFTLVSSKPTLEEW